MSLRAVGPERRQLALLTGLWIAILIVLIAFRSVVLPFAVAGLIAYILEPVVNAITDLPIGRWRIPHWLAILFIYALFFVLVYLLLLALLPRLYREALHIGRLVTDVAQDLSPERIQKTAQRVEDWLADRGISVALSKRALESGVTPEGTHGSLALDLEQVVRDSAAHLSEQIRANAGQLVGWSQHLVFGVLAGLFTLFFILMVAAYFSVDAKAIGRYARSLVPERYREPAVELLASVDRSLAGVVRGQFTICLINGVLTLAGLLVFHVRFAFILATVATVLALIPIFGTILSSLPILLTGLLQSWHTGLGMLIWILGIHGLEAYVLNPRIMGRAARIHPVVVAFALLAGEQAAGIVGGLLAVPLAAVGVATFEFVRLKAQGSPPLPAEIKP